MRSSLTLRCVILFLRCGVGRFQLLELSFKLRPIAERRKHLAASKDRPARDLQLYLRRQAITDLFLVQPSETCLPGFGIEDFYRLFGQSQLLLRLQRARVSRASVGGVERRMQSAAGIHSIGQAGTERSGSRIVLVQACNIIRSAHLVKSYSDS